jgi:GT2 family glycosyltransferase
LNYLSDIVIVNFNTKKYLDDCLQSIRKFTGPKNSYRIWVIDNGSTDGSASLIKAAEGITGIFNRENRGYGRACNQGIRAGTGDYIFLLNSDTQVTSGWLLPLIQTLASDPKIAITGPKLVNPEKRLVGAGVIGTNAHPIIRGWGEPDEPGRFDQPLKCVSVCGACMGIKRQLLPQLGLFDEHYFHYYEETDYCYNARFRGFKIVYCPDSTVIHRVFGSCRDLRVLNRYFSESRAYFHTKWKEFLKDETEYH